MIGYRTRHLTSEIIDFTAAGRALISSVATGLTYTAASGQLSITSGYAIPTTTQASHWETAYGWGDHGAAGYALASALSGYVPTSRTVNGHALTADVSVSQSDVGLGNVTNDSQVKRSEMGQASGVATLGTDGKLPTAQLPALAVVDFLGSVASQAAMLALAGQRGDWCTRSDLSTIWVVTGDDPTQLASWTQLSYPTAPVTSVAGKTGAVVLAKADVGLGNVENTALSTWAGTANITTLGTIATGTWHGSAIADTYLASAANWNTAYGWGNHAGLYDATGAATAAVSAHTTAYDHTKLHAAVTLDTSADALLSLTGQAVTLDSQAANTFFAGPTSGDAATPAFRGLNSADLPTMPVAKGGSGLTTVAAGSVLAANTADTISAISSTSGVKVLVNSSGSVAWNATNGTGSVVFANSPSLVSPTLGNAVATTLNKLAITAPATGATLAIADGKTFTASNSLTLAGTDGTTQTFPATSGTVYTSAGDTIPVGKGGTGLASWTAYALVYASGATALSQLAVGAVGQVLQGGGASAAPAWSTWTAPTTVAAGSILAANTANALTAITATSGTWVLQNSAGTISWASSGATFPSIISANTALYIATTGNDTTGTGSEAAPWATLAKAVSWLAGKWINSDVGVTVYIGDGTYNSWAKVTITSPFFRQVSFRGTNVYTKTLNSVQSSSGSARAWSIVLNLNSVANIAVGDYVIIKSTTGGTNPVWLQGCFPVTAVDGVNNRITVTTTHAGASAPSGAVTTTAVTVLKTILKFNSCDGISVTGGYVASIDRMALVGTVAANTYGLSVSNLGFVSAGASLAACDFDYGFSTLWMGYLETYLVTASGNRTAGYLAFNGIGKAIGIFSGNGPRESAVGGCGIRVAAQSMVMGAVNVLTGNGGTAITVESASNFVGSGDAIDAHAIAGVLVTGGSFYSVSSTTISGCPWGLWCEYMSSADAAGVTFSGNTNVSSPALNTVGNNNSCIRG